MPNNPIRRPRAFRDNTPVGGAADFIDRVFGKMARAIVRESAAHVREAASYYDAILRWRMHSRSRHYVENGTVDILQRALLRTWMKTGYRINLGTITLKHLASERSCAAINTHTSSRSLQSMLTDSCVTDVPEDFRTIVGHTVHHTYNVIPQFFLPSVPHRRIPIDGSTDMNTSLLHLYTRGKYMPVAAVATGQMPPVTNRDFIDNMFRRMRYAGIRVPAAHEPASCRCKLMNDDLSRDVLRNERQFLSMIYQQEMTPFVGHSPSFVGTTQLSIQHATTSNIYARPNGHMYMDIETSMEHARVFVRSMCEKGVITDEDHDRFMELCNLNASLLCNVYTVLLYAQNILPLLMWQTHTRAASTVVAHINKSVLRKFYTFSNNTAATSSDALYWSLCAVAQLFSGTQCMNLPFGVFGSSSGMLRIRMEMSGPVSHDVQYSVLSGRCHSFLGALM